jgi:hypothetical protein
MNKKILFVHIPKTAGTSFRFAAQNYFGKENTFYDYGPSSMETSQVILKNVHEERDLYELSQKFARHDKLFLSGHFSVENYMYLFETLNVISFVRNPMEQVVSHYNHFKKDHGYEKELKDFVKEERFKNIQARCLKAKPSELFGFIGITEQYEKSIEMINAYYDINLEVFSENINKDKEVKYNSLSNGMKKLIMKENKEDFILYEKAKKIFENRVSCFNEKRKYTHIFIQEQTDKRIKGVAIEKNNSEPVRVEIDDYGRKVSVKAKELRPGLLEQRLPRNEYVGFEYFFQKRKNT